MPLDHLWLQGNTVSSRIYLAPSRQYLILALVGCSQMSLEGSFGLEFNMGWTVKTQVRVSLDVVTLYVPQQILLSVVIDLTHAALPVFCSTSILFTNAILLHEFW